MAVTIAEMQARLSADTSRYDRSLQGSETRLEAFSRVARRSGLIIGGALVAGTGLAIKSASDLNEQINKTNVVFRTSGREIVEWSKGLTESFGLSQRAALESAGTFGNMLVPMGIARDRAGEMSMQMVELAGDMASFNNASPEDTLTALRSGLAGETEPLRRFGVDLRVAALQEFALSEGIKQSVTEMTGAQRAQLIYRKLLADTTDQQGDFTRTAGSLANQQRILRAELENLAAQIGTALLPIVQSLAQAILRLVGFFQRHTTAAKVLMGVLATYAATVLLLIPIVRTIRAVTAAWVAVQWALNAALVANPIGAVIVAVVALAAAIVIAYKKSETFRNVVSAAIDFVKRHWDLLLLAFGPFGLLIGQIIKHFGDLRRIAVDAINAIIGPIETLVSWLRAAYNWVVNLSSKLGSLHVPDITPGFDVPGVPGFQHGGVVPGPLGAPRLIMAHGGETVTPRGGGTTIVLNANVVGGREAVVQWIRDGLYEWERRNGRPAF